MSASIDLTEIAMSAIKLVQEHLDSINSIPDEAWIYKKPIDVYVHGERHSFVLPPGKYRFFCKNTNPAPFSHPELEITFPQSEEHVHPTQERVVLRNTKSAREYTTVFSVKQQSEFIVDISCHTFISEVLKVGRCHVFIGFVRIA
ncbi:MAG TPA: hypothetical protein PLX54_02735 [Candidatus Fermentibacter daniensis]|jgi:hypothetical protein|nr:hypothetical protein [Candidatus Fermentibacter sp.]HOA05201.1 hypothetical protein [Candidatus Fermentibacter daniensis]HPO33985.1 hypothetical protein [Deltaproteobacteria bacterium]HOD19108.1 hypothetical protein [Candidatus Fermentibacter daniensis]HOF67781.1 hypothetical protein [Candidatus Fermentibacter daniensis]